MDKRFENEVLVAVRGLEKGQGLTITPGLNILTTRPNIEKHSLVSSYANNHDDRYRRKHGASSGRSFNRKGNSSVLKYKDLKPEEKEIVDLMSRMAIEIATMTAQTTVKTKYGVLDMYSVIDELHETEYVVTTTIEGNILFIDRPGDVMVHPIPPFLHKLRQ